MGAERENFRYGASLISMFLVIVFGGALGLFSGWAWLYVGVPLAIVLRFGIIALTRRLYRDDPGIR